MVLRKYPKAYEAMAKRHEVYNKTLEYVNERERAGEVLVIRPETALPIKRMEKDPAVLKLVYETGRKTAKEQLDTVRDFLSEK